MPLSSSMLKSQLVLLGQLNAQKSARASWQLNV